MCGSKTVSGFEQRQNSYIKFLKDHAHILADPSHPERFTNKFTVRYPKFITKTLLSGDSKNV